MIEVIEGVQVIDVTACHRLTSITATTSTSSTTSTRETTDAPSLDARVRGCYRMHRRTEGVFERRHRRAHAGDSDDL
jgi:hypothetical protein